MTQDLSLAEVYSQASQISKVHGDKELTFKEKAEQIRAIVKKHGPNPNAPVPFAHLHLHTPWSLLDGFCRIEDMILLAIEYGMTSIGVSEHGNCHSHVEFYEKCIIAGIKPVLGCEVYITPNRFWKKEEYSSHKENFWINKKEDTGWRPNMAHLLLIAKNNEGYQNLLEMTSRAYLEGFYFKPRTDYELIKKYGKGIIATTSCLGGEVPQLIRQGKYRAAKNIIRFYQECFDELYLEVQPSTMPEQILVNNVLMAWSKELDIPLVGTSDAHMLHKEEKSIHAALTVIGKSEDTSDISVYEHCYFMSAKEMLEFKIPEEALRNAQDIADRCNVTLEMGVTKYPKFDVPGGYTFDTYLARLANEALFDMALTKSIDIKKYQQRLRYELKIVQDKKISAYFLIVWDFVKFAKDNGILTGPGRGSAAGSLISYLLKITNIDPIKYDLMFERFINPERMSFPDIDMDFSYTRRHEVIEYLNKKYGAENVAQIGTFGTLSSKAALKDIGRGLGIDHHLINEMNKLIPVSQGKVLPIKDCLEQVPEIKEWERQYPKLFELAQKVESLPRTSSVHACGVLISDESIAASIPVSRSKEGGMVTQYEGPVLEKIGYIKFDILGLKNLSVIDIARDLVQKNHGVAVNVDNLEPTDPKVYELIRSGNTLGIFQIESEGMAKVFNGLNKVDFESLIAGISLYRPGPMAFIPQYQARANGSEDVSYAHPDFAKVLGNTFGILVYQEQLMRLSQVFGGFSEGESDTLRKATGKKSQAVMDKVLPELHARILSMGYAQDIADSIIKLVEPWVGYGFNRSHAASYAYIAYQTAYFKTYYPAEFFASLLTVFSDDQDKVIKYIANAKDMGISVLPPDVNHSGTGFTIEERDLRFGLASIKGLGTSVLDYIAENRPFSSLEYIVQNVPKKSMNKKAIEVLSLTGAFDGLPIYINPDDDNNIKRPNRMELFQIILRMRGDKVDLEEEIKAFTFKAMLEKEQELLGIYISGHPLDDVCPPLNWNTVSNFDEFETAGIVTSFKEIKTKKGDAMAFVNLDTAGGNERAVLFPMQFAKLDVKLQHGLILKMKIQKKYDAARDEVSYIVDRVQVPKRINKSILN